MTRAEAKKIYSDVKAFVYVFGGDVRKRCRERGVPEAMLDELIVNDSTLNRFFESHDMTGEPRDGQE